MQTISIGTLKGGAGKSRTAENLAGALALAGKRVLLVDFDAQGDVTVAFGVQPQQGKTIGDLIQSTLDGGTLTVDDILVDRTETLSDNPRGGSLHILPAFLPPMQRAQRAMEAEPATGATVLRDLLAPLQRRYDYGIFDNKPDLGILHSAALNAANAVFGIMTSDVAPLRGGLSFAQSVEKLQKAGGDLRFLGVLLNLWEEKEEAGWVEDALEEQGVTVFDTRIPRSKLVSKCFSLGKPAVLQYPNSEVANLYLGLAAEVLTKMNVKAVA